MTTPAGSPLKITIDPSDFKIPSGYGHYASHITIENDGKIPVQVSIVLLREGINHACVQAAPTWITMGTNGKPFTLVPDQEHTIPFTVNAAPGVNGKIAMLAIASNPKGDAGKSAGAVGSTVTLGTGTQTCTHVRAVAPVHKTPGVTGLEWLAVSLGLCIVISVILGIVKRRQHGHITRGGK
jgi:hypothetical protein